MKKTIVIIISIFMLLSFSTLSFGTINTIPITMYLNGSLISSDVEPYVSNKTIFIPIKAFTDTIGIDEVIFNQDDSSVTIVNDEKTIKLFIDEKRILVNGNEYFINSKPTLINNRTMVPLDFISEVFACNVEFDNLTKSILITNKDLKLLSNINENFYTPEDVLWLARIVHVEANGTNYQCRLGVANVVLNRKKSSRFPNTIYGVIFQPGQFPPAHKKEFATLIPSEECILAAKNALNGENNVSKSLFFNNRPFSSKASELYKVIGGEYFYN